MYDTVGLTNNAGNPMITSGSGFDLGQGGLPRRGAPVQPDDTGVAELIAYLQQMLGTSGFWGNDSPGIRMPAPRAYSGQWGRMPR
jgi:hypothetical protein